MAGKVGRVTGTVAPGRLGEVMIPVRGDGAAANGDKPATNGHADEPVAVVATSPATPAQPPEPPAPPAPAAPPARPERQPED